MSWEVGYWDPLLAIWGECVCAVICCSMFKPGKRRLSRRVGDLVTQRFLFCEGSLISATRVPVIDSLFFFFWWIWIKKMRNLLSGNISQGEFLDRSGADLFLLQEQPVFYITWCSDHLPPELDRGKGDSLPGAFPGCHQAIPLVIYCQNHSSNQLTVMWGTVKRA